MDSHHLRVNGEWDVDVMATASAFEWDKNVLRVLRLLLWLVFLFLQLLLQTDQRRTVEYALGDAAMLESSAIEAWFIVIVALANDLAAIHDDTSVLVVQGGLSRLLEAERQISVSLHFAGQWVAEWN